jgi:hypothetical protein
MEGRGPGTLIDPALALSRLALKVNFKLSKSDQRHRTSSLKKEEEDKK